MPGYNRVMSTERTNEAWLRDLNTAGPERQQALDDLQQVIRGGLPYGLSKWLRPDDPRFEPLVEEVVQETLLRVLDRLDTFEGRSKFTTWVYTIAVRLALSELRKAKWREVSLDQILEANPNYFSSDGGGYQSDLENPESHAEQADMVERIERIIREELTDRQRAALIALAIQGMPMDQVAEQLNTNRNALYKLMHDARLRLKTRLQSEGLMPEDIFAAFE